MKKCIVWSILFICLLVCLFVFWKKNAPQVQPEEARIFAVITSVDSGIMEVKTIENGSAIRIPKFIDFLMIGPEYAVGDTVEIVYDGIMQESYPLTLGTVYRIDFVEKGKQEKAASRAVMVDGVLYFDTGEVSDEPRCGMMDGQITSSCSAAELPTQDNQSNFGSDYGYQFGVETIDVLIDGHWIVFAKERTKG